LFIAAGFIVGAYGGAKIAEHIDDALLSRIFGFVLFAISIKMILNK